MTTHDPPILKPAQTIPLDPKHRAAIIFLHGFADDAEGFSNIPDQFAQHKALPHLQWLLPNAPINRDAMDRAWYTPTSLPARAPSRPELEDDEDEAGLLASRSYIISLIDSLVESGIPPERIVLAGFSQGHAMALLTGLTGKYAGRLAGLAGFMGYLPVRERIQGIRAEEGLPSEVGDVRILVVRGTRDVLVPKRYFEMGKEKLKELGVREDGVRYSEYEIEHRMDGRVLKEFRDWLEVVVPALE